MPVTRRLVSALLAVPVLIACGRADTDVAFAPLSAQAAPAASPAGEVEGPYRVVDVVDGDTAKVAVDGRTETVRVIGLDTPEVAHPSKPVQCFGRAASDRADALLTGREVRLEADATQAEVDRYGRRLAHVWVEDVNFALVMINDGYAHEYTYSVPHSYTEAYRAAEADAAAAERGLWSPATCDGDTAQPEE
ncbi:MAG: thermonuclease family protein [Acidimicrobiia bacterium]|nr:thermonuclease family protein [Acidimicrobiia bacterium]